MAKNLVKITILFVSIYQLCQATPRIPLPSDETSNFPDIKSSVPAPPSKTPIPSKTDENSTPISLETPVDDDLTPTATQDSGSDNIPSESSNLTPTDPMDINRMAFRPLLKLYGNVGPLIYTLLTEKNAIGEQMSVVSKIIADRIGSDDLTKDMDLIFSNALNPDVSKKVIGIYEKIKDVHVEGTTDSTLENAVEIIMNILNNEEAVGNIKKILKTGSV